MKTIRAFIAIELEAQAHEHIQAIQNHLKKTGADIRWVKPGNIHLTLKFLGEISPEKIVMITQTMQKLVEPHPMFIMRLTQLGIFPQRGSPRIIWLGAESDKQEAVQLAGILENELEKAGFAKEKRTFSPHVTLGRFRSDTNYFALAHAMKEFKLADKIIQSVTGLTLFQSALTSQGPIYTALEKVTFREH